MDIHFFAKSDIGKIRNANEDYFLNEKIADNEYLFIVADGMGGHQAGDVASKLASDTFFESYKTLRKKNTAIMQSMELAIKKANNMVFKKAAADLEKRGMGTTFSALVVADMKAFIAHVGDSRIYLIRKNKIKKITTDHSFVEKLVEEGRISSEEARDHPQKNVLYMSLGARETFSPELLNEIILEDGDALVMCSDGLNNMVPDETLMNVTINDYPEEATDALIKLANANGGSDNITLQIIRVGSLAMLEKTKPLKLAKSRKKLITVVSLLALVGIILTTWYFLKALGRNETETKIEKKVNMSFLAEGQKPIKAQKINEIDANKLNNLGFAAAGCQFLIDHQLHFVKNNLLYVFDLQDLSLQSIELKGEDQVVPSGMADVYLLRRSPTQTIDYQLFRSDAKKPLLIIQADKQFDLKEMESRGGRIFKIANLQTRIIPDFINENIFIFHDLKRYYGIKNWQTADGQQFPVPDLLFSEVSQLFFEKIDSQMSMLYSNPEKSRAAVYWLKNFEKIKEYPLPQSPQPLVLEYGKNHSLFYYYPDQSIEITEDKQEIRRQYKFNNFQFKAIKILVDMENGQKLFINDGNKLFTLLQDS